MLQIKTFDLSLATSKVKELKATIGKNRNDAQNTFKQIFVKAYEVMEKLDVKIKKPRVTTKNKCIVTILMCSMMTFIYIYTLTR